MSITRIHYQNSYMDTYMNDFDQLKPFYEYDPLSKAGIEARLEYLDRSIDLQRQNQVGRSLLIYNQRFGCSVATEENIQLLAAGSAYAIVTGQQSGLLTGPLYTIYKILTAISLAEKITQEHDINVVPVFWAASEDHDFMEIANFTVVNDAYQVQSTAIPSPTQGRISIGYLPLNHRVREVIDFLAESITDAPHRESYLKMLEEAFDESENIADWCSRIISRLFSRYGLIIVDSLDPNLRRLSSDLFQKAVMHHDRMYDALETASRNLENLGYKRQLDLSADALFFFYNTQKGRFQIQQNASGTYTVQGDRSISWTKEALLEQISAHPENFSPNAAFRPMVQDHLLPTLAYIAGPGEVAYYGQLRNLYPLMEQQMPVIYPRFAATLIYPEIALQLQKIGLTVENLLTHGWEKTNQLIQTKAPFSVAQRFDRFREDFQTMYDSLIADISVIDPDLAKIAPGNLGRINHQIGYLEKKTLQKVRKREKPTVMEIERIREFLQPDQKPQERIFNVFPFLFRYGDALLDQIMQADPWNSFSHTLIYLGDDDHR